MVNFWKDKRVFITGANGFLGSHLTKALVERGNRPLVLIYEPNPGSIFDEERLATKTNVIAGDVRNLRLLERLIERNKIDTIFHLAAQAIVDQAIEDPLVTFEVNVQGSWNVLEAAKKYNRVRRIIVASSDKAYGAHARLPYREDNHHLKGGYSYETSKACVDLLCQSHWWTFQLPICITRCSNLYGPGDLKFHRIMPNTIRQLYLNQPPLIKDTGRSLRDYLYIEDAVSGYLCLAEKMGQSIGGQAFNFATNKPLSVAEVIERVSREMGKTIKPLIIKTKGFEIRHQYASYAKAKKLLGWSPQYNFREGLRKTIPWYVNYFRSQ